MRQCAASRSTAEGRDGVDAHLSKVADKVAACSTFPMKKTKPAANKKNARKKEPRKDATQSALSIAEQVTGGKLKPKS